MSDHAKKVAEKDASLNRGPRDVSKEASQTQERYNTAYHLAKKN